jgi:outer membrane protein assembly factor BamA
MVGAGFKLYLAGDRYRAALSAGYGNLHLQYYGASSDSPFFDHPAGFLVRGTLLDGSLQVRVANHLYAGLKARYLNPVVTLDRPIDSLPDLRAEFELAALGVVGEYDTRDNVWYPVSGSRGDIEVLRYASQSGSDETFLTLDASYSGYWGLSERLVFVGNVRAAHAGDDTPFFMLPFVSIRGFPAGQYMDQSVVQGETELRWMFRNNFGAVVFAGAGIAAPGFTSLGDGRDAYGFGGGLRYSISDVDKLNLGIDVAYGSSDNVAVYFRVSEAF